MALLIMHCVMGIKLISLKFINRLTGANKLKP